MNSSSSKSASTPTPVNSTSPSIGSAGDVIQILENEYKAILTDLNAKKFPKIKEVNINRNINTHIIRDYLLLIIYTKLFLYLRSH